MKVVKAAMVFGVLLAGSLSQAFAAPVAAGTESAQETLVVVQRITGVDRGGKRQELFADATGKAVPMEQLVTVVSELEARKAGHVGVFTDIRLELGDVRYLMGANGLVLTEKKKGSTVELAGSLDLTRSGTRADGLELKRQ